MFDRGAVLCGRASVGKNGHIGACTVLAGVIEPPSAQPVIVEDDVVMADYIAKTMDFLNGFDVTIESANEI